MPSFYEFFAGGGMAAAGLGKNWKCLFANDIEPKKAAAYSANWGSEHLKIEDIRSLTSADLPGHADLAWASFPCQDLSLAGVGAGLKGERSGTFWAFWGHMKALADEGRGPLLVVLENVCGALSSHAGQDFAAIGAAIAEGGYRFGAVVIDAVHFLPQSRPRLFIVAIREDRTIPARLTTSAPSPRWHPAHMVTAYGKLSRKSQSAWIWWNLPEPRAKRTALSGFVENDPRGVVWHTEAETRRLLAMMSPINRSKVDQAKRAQRTVAGTIYKRTRKSGAGERVQRAEVRFDNVAGCLRTPVGGSSRQTIAIVDGDRLRTRLLSPREAARLMGLPDSYKLPANYNEAYHLAGDGVAVPVVRFLAAHLLEPVLSAQGGRAREVA